MTAGRAPRQCRPSVELRRCLEKVFGKPIGGIRVRNKRYVKNRFITTRRNSIRLPPDFPGHEFFADPFLMLHEYYHVLEQWNTGKLSRLGYSIEFLRHGSSHGNKYEDAANGFARAHLEDFKKCLAGQCASQPV